MVVVVYCMLWFVVQYCTVWCDEIWYGTVHGMVQYIRVWYGTLGYDLGWYGGLGYGMDNDIMVICGMVQYDVICYGMVHT